MPPIVLRTCGLTRRYGSLEAVTDLSLEVYEGEVFIYSNFPLILLMFFTGAVFPIPPIPLFTIAGRTIALFDFLPPTHAVVALNKVLTLGAGLSDVGYELTALFVLSAIYFAAGIWLFKRIHLRTW